MKSGAKDRSHVFKPAVFPDYLEEEAEVFDNWLQVEDATAQQRASALSCLSEDHLRSLEPTKKSTLLRENPEPREWRYAFRSQVAKILWWTHRRPFPEYIDALIHHLWPEKHHEARGIVEGCRKGEGSGAPAAEKSKHTAPSEETCTKDSEGSGGSKSMRATVATDSSRKPGALHIAEAQMPHAATGAISRSIYIGDVCPREFGGHGAISGCKRRNVSMSADGSSKQSESTGRSTDIGACNKKTSRE
jgi:hypothetical protein